MAACIFCKIIKGNLLNPLVFKPLHIGLITGCDIPCFKLFESDKTLAFLDINPLSKGHALVIPKFHGEKLTDIPDDHLSEILPVAKKLVTATGATNYNILQNNGRIAHQVVDHIPKPSEEQGLGVGWPQQPTDMDALKALSEDIKSKI
ncbi:HIT domain-containing protein [Biscogniauxia mediterranea]|nr:HIT domain-containing protein [Biscogniauxia mediterranea]